MQRAAGPVGIAQHAVVSLLLPVVRSQRGAQMLAEKFHREALLGGFFVETEPDEMGVVGHQHIGGAGEVPAGAGVEERELPRVVKRGGKPASRAVVEGGRPEYAGSAAVEFGGETG